ncbi:hypothetical protein [Actinomadura fibrosa]|uniref:Uncharacterized protein n=1 Tax=Actinomadura fibrosa TaxID=111802 RepID=A0ABW2XDE7_9ACTN|nr:hypothetical protein [Actinomadura fibrosa]
MTLPDARTGSIMLSPDETRAVAALLEKLAERHPDEVLCASAVDLAEVLRELAAIADARGAAGGGTIHR